MPRCLIFFLVLFLVAKHGLAARDLPSSNAKGLSDQKNYFQFAGLGGYSGIGNNGIPYGGVGGAMGTGGVLGGPPLNAVGGLIGTGPDGRLVGAAGVIPGGVVTIGGNSGNIAGGGLGGAGAGLGGGGGGVLPNP